MVDPAFLRDNLEAVRTALQNRGLDLTAELEQLATLESRRRRLLPELEGLKREQNTAGDEVAFSHCLIRCEGSQGEGSYLPVRLTLCYQKVDGQWLIAHEHHSVPFETSDD